MTSAMQRDRYCRITVQCMKLSVVDCTVTVTVIAFAPSCLATAALWAGLMDELREIHLGLKPKRRTGPSVGERLQAAYEKVMAKSVKG